MYNSSVGSLYLGCKTQVTALILCLESHLPAAVPERERGEPWCRDPGLISCPRLAGSTGGSGTGPRCCGVTQGPGCHACPPTAHGRGCPSCSRWSDPRQSGRAPDASTHLSCGAVDRGLGLQASLFTWKVHTETRIMNRAGFRISLDMSDGAMTVLASWFLFPLTLENVRQSKIERCIEGPVCPPPRAYSWLLLCVS